MSSHVSRNVLACKLLKCSQALARGLWNNGILSPYLLLLMGGSKTAVGLVQGLFGLSTAAIALPVGILSDRTARHIVAKLSAFLDLAAIILTSAGVLASHGQYHLLCAAGVFWGLSTACDSNTDALFADSVPTLQRSAEFTQLQALSLACLGGGPLIAAFIFHQQGNEWTLHQLGIVIMCGMGAAIAPVFFKLLVHDKYTLGAESDAYARPGPSAGGPRPTGSHDSAVAAVAAGVDAHAADDLVDLKDNAAPFCHRSRSSGRGQPSLPAIRSGAELRFDDSGAVLSADEDTAADGAQTGAVGPVYGADSAAGAAAAAAAAVAEDYMAAGGGDCSAAARDHGAHTCVQGDNGGGRHRSPFVEPSEGVHEPLLGAADHAASAHEAEIAAEANGHQHTAWGFWPERLVLGPQWVPYLVFSADLMSGLASGMTIKFFPIFFMDKALLTPMANSLLFAATPIGIAAAMFLAHRLAGAVGRVPSMLCLRWLGVSLLLLMAVAPALWRVPAAIMPIYLARTACANGTSALGRSILMDFVPKESRGRWSSLDGVTIFGWSGSAMLGGFLLDRFGFRAVFAVTAAMQFSGSLFIAALLPVVPRHEAAAVAAAPCAVATPRSVSSDKSPPGVTLRSGSGASGGSTPLGEEDGMPVRWEKTLHPQRLSIDGEEEIAQSFSSSFSGA